MQYNNNLVKGKERSEKKDEKKERKCSEEKSLHYHHVIMSCYHYAIPVAIDLNQTEYRVVVIVTRRKRMQAIKKQRQKTQTRQQKYKSSTTLTSNSSTIPSFLELPPSQRETTTFKICRPTLVRGEKKHWFDDFIARRSVCLGDQAVTSVRQCN